MTGIIANHTDPDLHDSSNLNIIVCRVDQADQLENLDAILKRLIVKLEQVLTSEKTALTNKKTI